MTQCIHWDDTRLKLNKNFARGFTAANHVCFPRIPGLDDSDYVCAECSLAGSVTVMPRMFISLHLLYNGIQPMETFRRLFILFIPDEYTSPWFRVYITGHTCQPNHRLHRECKLQTCIQVITGGLDTPDEYNLYAKGLCRADDWYLTNFPLQSVPYVIFDPHCFYTAQYESYLDLINY